MDQSELRQQTLANFSGTFGNIFAGFIVDRQARGLAKDTIAYYIKNRTDLKPSAPLFVTDENDRLSYSSLVNILRRRSSDAGVKMPMPHDFRRTFAIEMLRNGCDLARLAELMGHNTLEVLRRYLHLVYDDLREAHQQAGPPVFYSYQALSILSSRTHQLTEYAMTLGWLQVVNFVISYRLLSR